jgi:type IV pilus assembly protein PilQ
MTARFRELLCFALIALTQACASVPDLEPRTTVLVDDEILKSQLSVREYLPRSKRSPRAIERFSCVEDAEQMDLSEIPDIDVSFIESDLREVLLELSMLTEVPIVADESVQGIVSASLQGKSLSTTLGVVLAPGNYAFKIFEDFIFVGSQYQGSPSLSLLSKTCRFSPSHMQVTSLAALIDPVDKQFIHINEENNLISITAPDRQQRRMRRLLELLDKPVDQVLLEVSIVEVNKEVFDILGINWNNLNIIEQGLDVALTNELFGSPDGDQSNYNYIGSRLPTPMDRFKDSIGVLKNRGDADIKAMPSIVTLDGKEAKFTSTETIWLPLVNDGSNKSTGLAYGVNIKLIPHIRSDDDIRLDIVDASVSDLTSSSTGNPILVSHSVSNSVEISDGDLVVLGGLLQKKNRNQEARVPLLSRMPGAGKLFSQDKTEIRETEVLIVIRPTILSRT